MRDAAAWLIGESVSLRKLVDWTELGLIPAPRKERRADGSRGSQATWSPTGYLLWLNMLASQEIVRADVASLANAPVGVWIYTDTDWVELVQLRRALITWRSRRTTYRSGQLVSSASELVRRIAHHDAPVWTKRRLREMLSVRDWDREFSRKQIRTAVRGVVAPGGVAGTAGPWTLGWVADHVANQLIERFTGLTLLPQHPYAAGHDAQLLEARQLVRAETERHERDPLARELDRRLKAVDVLIGADERIQVSCLDLVTMLGRVRLREIELSNA